MIAYRAMAGDCGVVGFEPGADSIKVKFHGGAVYLYNYACTSKRHVEAMKKLAAKGRGLSTYISQHVRDHYAAKIA